jgi:hypothetical protein
LAGSEIVSARLISPAERSGGKTEKSVSRVMDWRSWLGRRP